MKPKKCQQTLLLGGTLDETILSPVKLLYNHKIYLQLDFFHMCYKLASLQVVYVKNGSTVFGGHRPCPCQLTNEL